MWIFTFLIAFFILLIVITISTTIIKLSLLVSTRFKYETYLLIIPGLLYSLLWLVLIAAWFYTVNYFVDGNFINMIFDVLLNVDGASLPYQQVIIWAIAYSALGIFFQTFIFMFVNIPYRRIGIKIKNLFKKLYTFIRTKLFKKDPKPELMPTNELYIPEKWVKLSVGNSLISSMFSFSMVVFVITILLTISNVITEKLLTSINSTDETTQIEQIEETQEN